MHMYRQFSQMGKAKYSVFRRARAMQRLKSFVSTTQLAKTNLCEAFAGPQSAIAQLYIIVKRTYGACVRTKVYSKSLALFIKNTSPARMHPPLHFTSCRWSPS